MSGKIHLRADGLYPRPGHTWHPERTLCGKMEQALPEKPDGECKQCYRVWRQLAEHNLRCGA